MVLLSLDRKRALIFTSDTCYEPQGIALNYALDWLQKTRGTFGLIAKAKNNKVYCELFAVLFEDEPGDADIKNRSERLLETVSSWV